MDQLTELLKGALEGCVMEIISRRQTYGYEITRQLHSLGFDTIVEGTVYTILLRLEKRGLVEVVKKPSAIGPARKFYSLNADGRKELQQFWEKWAFVCAKINQLKELDLNV